MSGVALVSFTNVDLNALLPIMRQALERSVSAPADAAGASPPLHHMLCIAAIKDDKTRNAESVKPYLNLFHAGFIIGAYSDLFAEVLEVAGLPCIMVDTKARDIKCAYIVGSVAQWRDALVRGCTPVTSQEVRHIYNLVYREFGKVGLSSVMDVTTKLHTDKTTLIKYKGS